MAMQQLLFCEDDLSDADLKRMLTEETTFGGNNSKLIANKLSMKNLNTHNNNIPSHHHQKPILGQIGLNRVMNKNQKTQGSSNANGRVTQPMNCHGLQVSEIVRDRAITISTRQHISISNQHHDFPNQPFLENMVRGVINQTPIEGLRSSSFNTCGFQPKHNSGGAGNSSHLHMHSQEMNDQVIHPNFQLNCNSGGLKLPMPRVFSPLLNHCTMEHQPKFDELGEQKNHAPYKCTKCDERFITTRCFATHVMAHYEYEKKVERLKRQESKHREKLHLVQSNDGVLSEGHRSKKPKMTVKTVAVAKKD